MNFLRRVTQRIHASQSERNVPEVLPIDWWWVGQTVRDTLGLDYAVWEPIQYPHVEMLAAWEAFLPGSTARLRAIAQSEAQHREWMAAHGVERTVPV